MTVEDTVAEVIAKVGIWWPVADESDLRAAADAWDTFAAALDTAAAGGSAAATTVTTANTGPAIDAFAAFWSRYNGSCSGYLPSTATAARGIARACRDYAEAVVDAKDRVRELAIEIGASLVVGAGLAIFTFGASQAAATAVAASLVARAAAIGIQLSARAASIVGSAISYAGFGAVEAAAVDIAVAQPIRVEIFDRGGYSGREAAMSAGVGGALGSFAPALAMVRSPITEALELTGKRAVPTPSAFGRGQIEQVMAHLRSIDALDAHPPNLAMVRRVEDAVAAGRPLTEGERNFMLHEVRESELMAQGVAQEAAHEMAGRLHPTFANYDPEVIKQYPEFFNSNWRRYWGIE